ncbi:MAG: NUDIX hydrolase [Candidatus Firestonebacteria bacterium]
MFVKVYKVKKQVVKEKMNRITIKGIKIEIAGGKAKAQGRTFTFLLSGNTETKLRKAAAKAVKTAAGAGVKGVLFSVLGGKEPFSFNQAGKIIAQEIYRYIFEYRKQSVRCFKVKLAENVEKEAFRKGFISYLNYFGNEQKSPFLTTDCIVRVKGGIVVIERSNPPLGFALPGGFVDYGESLEAAVKREMKEETGLKLLNLRQFHVYSKPGRDPRFHVVTVVFTADSKGLPRAGDDAKSVRVVGRGKIMKMKFASDHKRVLLDYFRSKIEKQKDRK